MDEPNALMRWVMFHFAGGDALFAAAIGLLIITFVPEDAKSAWRWTLLTGLVLIWGGFSSPAWPLALLIMLLVFVLLWRVVVHVQSRKSPAVNVMTWCLRLVIVSLLLLERSGSGQVMHGPPPTSVCVIADSITAGLNDGEVTWPRLFSERTGVEVFDASQPGATYRSAIQQAESLDDDRTPLVLEVGGNDLLSGRSLADFSRDCEELCQRVCTPGRMVWMCELPLPPGKSQYGAAQRRICRQQRVRLIPKREMMRVLTTAGATVDGIHLSLAGQQRFCDLMQETTGCITDMKLSTDRYYKIEHPRRTD